MQQCDCYPDGVCPLYNRMTTAQYNRELREHEPHDDECAWVLSRMSEDRKDKYYREEYLGKTYTGYKCW